MSRKNKDTGRADTMKDRSTKNKAVGGALLLTAVFGFAVFVYRITCYQRIFLY